MTTGANHNYWFDSFDLTVVLGVVVMVGYWEVLHPFGVQVHLFIILGNMVEL